MRFFWTGNFKSSKPIRIAILFFNIFVLMFWVGNFIHFGLKFGYSIEKIGNYFFGEPDFPLEISLAQIAEESHINLFVFSLLFLCVCALLVYAGLSEKVKVFFILSFAVSGFLYAVSDYLIFYLGRDFVFLKIVLFFAFQFMIFLTMLGVLLKGSRKNNGSLRMIAVIIFMFAILNVCFVVLNFVLFGGKIGFKVSDVIGYYLGDPQRFIKPRSVQGLVEISQIHFLPMALYLVALSHFVFLVNDKFNVALTVFLFITALLDNVSGVLIVLFGAFFAVVKIVSFFSLQILLLLSSLILVYKLLALKFNFPNRGHI